MDVIADHEKIFINTSQKGKKFLFISIYSTYVIPPQLLVRCIPLLARMFSIRFPKTT